MRLGNNGNTKFLAVAVTLGISIIGMAFGFGVGYNQLAELRDQMNLLSQVNQRLAVYDEHLAQIEEHLNSIDQRINVRR